MQRRKWTGKRMTELSSRDSKVGGEYFIRPRSTAGSCHSIFNTPMTRRQLMKRVIPHIFSKTMELTMGRLFCFLNLCPSLLFQMPEKNSVEANRVKFKSQTRLGVHNSFHMPIWDIANLLCEFARTSKSWVLNIGFICPMHWGDT